MPAGELDRVLGLTALSAAPLLLGAVLRRRGPDGDVALRITELEAYEGERDPGSHAFRGPTPRNAVMFGPAGHLYAYLSYGVHVCLNIVCGEPGTASACLLRAGEVVEGASIARARRDAVRRPDARALSHAELARGPGNLVRALGAQIGDSGSRVDAEPYALELAPARIAESSIRNTLRVGVSTPGGLEPYRWRFFIDGDPTVSRYQPHATVRRALAE